MRRCKWWEQTMFTWTAYPLGTISNAACRRLDLESTHECFASEIWFKGEENLCEILQTCCGIFARLYSRANLEYPFHRGEVQSCSTSLQGTLTSTRSIPRKQGTYSVVNNVDKR